MEFNEDEYLMLSGIQHFHFCKRQWALIHIEQQWDENMLTIEGQYLHRKADNPFIREKRRNKLIVRGMPIKSSELGFSGICDVVEFVKNKNGIQLEGEEGTYIAYPVEYKRGKPKKDEADILQLAAQAMCLEEMLLLKIDIGYLYYNEIKHRVEIPITESLKNRVRLIAKEMHDYYQRSYTPKVKMRPACNSCSLHYVCVPNMLSKRSVKSYIDRKIVQ